MNKLSILFLVALLIGVLVIVEYHSNVEWENFKQYHHCEIVDTRVERQFIFVGKVLVPINKNQSLWRCDDGSEHWK